MTLHKLIDAVASKLSKLKAVQQNISILESVTLSLAGQCMCMCLPLFKSNKHDIFEKEY